MPHSHRPTRHPGVRHPLFQLVARILVLTLIGQSMPMHAARPAAAGTGPAIRWVDAAGGCDGHVPCHRRIQDAIDAARAGEIVRVLPGEYVEQLRIQRKNASSRDASDRIVIEADPAAPADGVVLRGARGRCEGGYAVDFDRSRYVTLRGLTIAGAGQRGIGLRGGSRQNVGVQLERNRVLRGSTGECSGGIDVGRGNPDTVIANNLVYANGRNGLRFRDGTGGSYLVYGNTIARNGWNGIAISRAAQARIWNNVIAFNGTAPERLGGRTGIRRQRVQDPRPQDVDLRHNLICGNRLDEIVGPVLDPADVGNLTPTGSEGAGVGASPRCGMVDELLAHPAGPDATLDTLDDSFALAPDAPAVDAGLDPRALAPVIEARLFEADHAAEGARPRDGDGDGAAAFDIGAVERAGAGGATPTPTPPATSTPSPVPTPTPTADATATPTPTPTASPTSTPGATPTVAPTATPTAAPTASPAPTIVPTANPTATPTPAPTASPAPTAPPTPPPTPAPTASPAPTPAPTASPTPSNAPTASPEPTPTASPRPGNRAPSAAGNRYTVRADQVLEVPAPGILGNDADADRDPLAALRVTEPGLGTLSLRDDGGFTFDPDEAQLACAGVSDPTGPVFAEPTTLIATQENSGRGGFGVARGDFDRDGELDLAVTVFDRVQGVLGNRLLVLRGNGDGTFQPPATLHTATDAEASLLGLLARDLDRDGLLDLLLVDNVRSQLLFFRGDGNGGFASPLASATAGRSHVVQVADLDGDGILDAIVASLTVTNLTALRGNGDGTFQTPVVLRDATQIGSGRIAVGDLNGDDAPDVVYGDGLRLGALLNANDGTGTLVARPTLAIPTARSLYLADFDGDDLLDVALAVSPCGWPGLDAASGGRPSPAFGFPACVAMLPGNGDGSFDRPTNDRIAGLPLGGDNVYAEPIVVDLDGNGALDVLLPPGHDNREANYVSVGLNTGDGTFRMAHWIASAAGTPPRPITTDVDGFYSNALLADDFTGDEIPDVVVTGGSIGGLGSTVAVSLVRGIGDGRFFTGQGLTLGPLPYDFRGPAIGYSVAFNAVTNLAVGDFDGDGLPEIVSAKGYQPIGYVYNTETIARRELAPDGSIGDPVVASPFLGGDFFYRMKPADFDRDGNLDLAFVQRNSSGSPQLVRIAYGDGTGNLSATVVFSYPYSGPWAGNFAVADFDGDGFPDVALLTTAGGIDVKRNGGASRTFTAAQSIAGPSGSSATRIGIVAADFDRDGLVDLVANAGTGATAGANQQQSLFYRGNGDGTFAAGVAVSSPLGGGGVTDYAAGDLDHDGKLDLLGNTFGGPLWVQLGNGDGTFRTAVSYSSPGSWLEEGSIALADIDRDGHLDVALSGSPSSFSSNRGILILPGRGDGTFAAPREVPAGISYGGDPVLADVNQDGLPDLLAGRGERREYAVMMLNAADRRAGCRKTDRFTYRASDGDLGSNTATVTIEILPANRAPVFTSVPPIVASEAIAYAYDVEATDPDPGDAVAFALIDGPPGMTIDPDTGVLAWLPHVGQTGSFGVVVRAYDTTGAFADQSWTVTVRSTVKVPDVVGRTRAEAEAAIVAASLVVGTVGSAPSRSVPAGSVISQSPLADASVVSGSPVSIVVSTGPPGPGETVASITVEPAAITLLAGESRAYRATATYADGTGADVTATVAWTSSADAVATIASDGVASALAAGSTTITATQDGVAGSATLNVVARVPGDVTPPLAEITSPTAGDEVTQPIDVVGSATDDAFLRYELALAPAGEDDFTVLATGDAPVAGGTLGVLYPTLLLNDLYTLRLTVYDRGGSTSSTEVVIQVARKMKLGELTLAYVDVEIPLDGIPLGVTRSYDSRDLRKGDFGFGWRLGLDTIRIRANRVLGTGWVRQVSGPSVALQATDLHTVSVTLPDGRVERFDMNVSPTSNIGALDFTNVTGFTPRPGATGTLTALANPGLLIVTAGPEDVLIDDTTLNTYDPQLFRYTTADGIEIDVHRTEGVRRVADRNGHSITVDDDGIAHSSGGTLTFTRDAEGRITRIVDPSGAQNLYEYDARGDLRRHTDPTGAVTELFYDARHRVVRIVDPLGHPVTRNEYDGDGRLVASTDAKGNRTAVQHDLTNRRELVTDRLGRTTTVVYDERGNVLSSTDPLGNTTTFTWDANDNQLSKTDPLGRTTTFTWDAGRRLTSTTDPLGHTTTSTYDAQGRPLTRTDALGRTTTQTSDVAGNPTSVTDALGHTTTLAYDAAGRVTTLTDPLGRSSTNQYDAYGRRTGIVEADGSAIALGNDAAGRIVSQTDDGGVAQTIAYDAAGRPTALGDGGVVRNLARDARGRLTGASTASGPTVAFEYDALGLPTVVRRGDGTVAQSNVYDAMGNLVAVTGALGGVMQHAYDGGDRLVSTTQPDGGVETHEYDAAGQRVATTDALGNRTAFAYDAAGRLVRTTDALGGVATIAYDAVGNVVAETDPLGRTTQYAYDAADRLIRTTYPDGTTEERRYDAAGQLVEIVDGAGHARSFGYDAAGRLDTVTDELGGTTTIAYDQGARTRTTTDASGRATVLRFDDRGRPVATRLPGGQEETTTYDAAGRVVARTNANGETVQLEYGTSGQPSRVILPGGGEETFTYTPDGLVASVTDARGVTTMQYDAGTRRLLRVTEPDGRYVRYAYDVLGRRTEVAHGGGAAAEQSTRYAYDALGRLIEVTDLDGGVTGIVRDAVGQVVALERPNGTLTEWTYDARGRITAIVHRDALGTVLEAYTYVLDARGNRLREQRHDGTRVEYAYDAAGRLVEERHLAANGTPSATIGYVHDAVGNLTARSGDLGAATFTYDANDRLVSGDGVAYTNDPAGNRTSATAAGGTTHYRWDARGRLTQVEPPTGSATDYVYDFDGTRVGSDGPGGAVDFLVDRADPTGLSQLLRETAPGGATLRTYVHGSGLLGEKSGSGWAWRHADALGSTRLLSDAAGAVTDTFDYSGYGETLVRTGSADVRHRFAGEPLDSESGLYHLRARSYDPATGRFVSRDPAIGDPTRPLSLNDYAYAHANPVNLTDPSGRSVPTNLTEVMAVIRTQLEVRGQQVLNFIQTQKRVADVTGDVVQRVGAALGFVALAEEVQNPKIVRLFFGKLVPGVTGNIGGLFGGLAGLTYQVIASGRLLQTVVRMAGENFDYRVDNLVACKPSYFAVAVQSPAASHIELCPTFFTLSPVPTSLKAVFGGASDASMSGVMVHEWTHITFRAKDDYYLCSRARSISGASAVDNADNYRCWVEYSAVGMSDDMAAKLFVF